MPPTRRQRTREAAIQSILAAARTIMREEGVAALSMQELARRMEMQAPSLYNYFASKMAIYDALFRLGFNLWGQVLDQIQATATDFHDELRQIIEGYMTFALDNPELYQLCFERPVPGFVPSPESLAVSVGILDQSRQRVERYRATLETELSSVQIVNLVIAITHGLTAMHLANEPHLPRGQGRFGSLIPVALLMLKKAIPVKGENQ